MVKTVNVSNKGDRVFNGVQPNRITPIPEHDLQAYERMGFQRFTSRTKKTKETEKKKQADRGNPKVSDAIVFLQQKEVGGAKRWRTTQLLEKAEDLCREYGEDSRDGQDARAEEAQAFLEAQGTTVGSHWLDSTILTKAKEAGREEVEQPADDAEDDLEALEDELQEEDKADK